MDTYQLTLPLLSIETAPNEAKEFLADAQKAYGMVPNMYAGMANAPGILSTYLHGYKLFRQNSGFTPAEQEVVFLSISRVNGCSYCVAAHSMVAAMMSNVPADVIEALRNGSAIADPRLSALGNFTTLMVEKRGNPSTDDVQAFLAAGFSECLVLEIVLAIAVKTLSNYSNHLFHTPVDDAFASFHGPETK